MSYFIGIVLVPFLWEQIFITLPTSHYNYNIFIHGFQCTYYTLFSVNICAILRLDYSLEREDVLLDMRIDFSDKYLPSDREETQRRVKADTALSVLLTAYERTAFRDGFKAAEEWLEDDYQLKARAEFNKSRFSKLMVIVIVVIEDIQQ